MQPVAACHVIYVIYIEVFMRLGILVKLLVEPGDEVTAAMDVPAVPVTQQTVERLLKIVLNNWAFVACCCLLPHGFKMSELFREKFFDMFC